MPLRTFVLRRGCGEHDQAVAIFHLRVSESAVRPNNARTLAESNSHREPVQRAHAVFIRNHWNNTLSLIRHSVPFNKLYLDAAPKSEYHLKQMTIRVKEIDSPVSTERIAGPHVSEVFRVVSVC